MFKNSVYKKRGGLYYPNWVTQQRIIKDRKYNRKVVIKFILSYIAALLLVFIIPGYKMLFQLSGGLPFPGPGSPASSGSSPITPSTTNMCAGGATGGTTSPTTTGGNFVGLHIAINNGNTFVISDSFTNTYTCNTRVTGTNPDGVICTAKNATTGAGHTITVTASGGGFPSFCAATFNNVSTSTPFDKESTPTTFGTGSSLTVPSTTPTNNGSLLLVGCSHSTQTFVNFNSGFTLAGSEPFAGGSNYSSDLGYLIQTTATAVAPTCAIAGADTMTETLSVFK